MRLLIIKLSSMGDILHLFPAITEASQSYPHLVIDWVVDSTFTEIVQLHPAIHRIFECPLRQWKKAPLRKDNFGKMQSFLKALSSQSYDHIIDAQGLLKSAIIAWLAKGKNRHGGDWKSCRESLATLAYTHRWPLTLYENRIQQLRKLFSQALDYTISDPCLSNPLARKRNHPSKKVFLIHGTTWSSKSWPLAYWIRLAHVLAKNNYEAQVTWNSPQEWEFVQSIQQQVPSVSILSQKSLSELAGLLPLACAVVSVDTGLGYLAQALGVQTFFLFGPTSGKQLGLSQLFPAPLSLEEDFACAPCFQRTCSLVPPSKDAPCFSEQQFKALLQSLCAYLEISL